MTRDSPRSAARLLGRIVDVREEEVRALTLSCAYFFFLLSSYFILRPIRDDMAVAGGVSELKWLFLGTLTATLIANPLFSALVARFTVRRFITISYRVFLVNLLVFYVIARAAAGEGTESAWLGRTFYVWTSVFNLFVVSVFWGFMADVFSTEQGKRLFGFIGVGGTLGAIAGGAITVSLAQVIGRANLLLVSAVLLEVALQFARNVRGGWLGGSASKVLESRIGGGVTSGIKHVFGSSYLLGICAYMLFFTIGSTLLYFQQAELVGAQITDRAVRTAFLAKIDLGVNTLTVLTQLFLTGRIMKSIGVGWTLGLLPAVSIVGFLAFGLGTTLTAFVVFQIVRRASEFALSRPAREVLYTVVTREDKYKAKSFIDTFVYRGGDQIGAWTYGGLALLGLGMSGIAFAAVPMAMVWLAVALWLGRRQIELGRASHVGAGAPPTESVRIGS
ncbi:MAG: MFS transporter [Anaerolineae bacterium]|nr:MFS transporter [Gemmatimonadaceae bacterium]